MSMKLIEIVTICTIFKSTTSINITEKQIEELEKQKSDLLLQINKAIDDSVNALKLSNDSDSLITLNHMIELKKEIREINSTQSNGNYVNIHEIDDETKTEYDKHANSSDVRRFGAIVSDRNTNIKLDLSEVAKLLKKKGDQLMHKQDMDKIAHQIQVQKNIEEWVLQRLKEKQRIIEYKKKLGFKAKNEKCPRYGLSEMKNKDNRRKSSDQGTGRKYKNKSKYPCCRKCCKMSYMECL